jgi:hypothetical protein
MQNPDQGVDIGDEAFGELAHEHAFLSAAAGVIRVNANLDRRFLFRGPGG